MLGWLLPLGIVHPAQGVSGFSLRFYGNGDGDIDRVKIPVEGRSINLGGDLWIFGNILFDRDVFGPGDYGDYGISLAGGRIAFGVNRGGDGFTLCGSLLVADGNWHHIAVTRRGSDGRMQIFVDGRLDATGWGPAGDIRYRDGRSTSYPNDPYLVIGAEKHDVDRATYPSYSGWIDEVRISRIIRYEGGFTPPRAPFTPDGDTVALYHFDEGPEGPCTGTVTDATGMNPGACRYGSADRPAGPVYVSDTPFAIPPPPVILSGPAVFPLATSAVVTWTTDVEATSEVRWGNVCGAWSQSLSNSDPKRTHSLVLDALSPGAFYCLQVRSANAGGNSDWTPGDGLGFTTRAVEFRIHLPLIQRASDR